MWPFDPSANFCNHSLIYFLEIFPLFCNLLVVPPCFCTGTCSYWNITVIITNVFILVLEKIIVSKDTLLPVT